MQTLRAFTDMIERWVSKYDASGSQAKLSFAIQCANGLNSRLIETILSAWALRYTGRWSMEELPELMERVCSITAAVLPRYHVDVNIKRSLGYSD